MRIVIAPDKFKGSISALAAADALAAGLAEELPEATLVRLPMADGGEGTVDAAVRAGYEPVTTTVSGPTGEPVAATFAVRQRAAVVELAQASGLAVLPDAVDPGRSDSVPAGLAPMTASSRGAGELIVAALDRGCRSIVFGVGGSACTDGGVGLLSALGARFRTADAHALADGGGALASLASVELSALDPRLAEVDLVLASDVDNPLLGAEGAAAVYGPQKGADPAQVQQLDQNLAHLVEVLAGVMGDGPRLAARLPGAGAAGGVGFAALALLGARRRPGVEVVTELVGLTDQLPGARLVITGEGALDSQTLAGKAPLGVLRAAQAAGVPTVAVCGQLMIEPEQVRAAGFASVLALTAAEPDLARCQADAGRLLVDVGRHLGRQLRRHPEPPARPAAVQRRDQLDEAANLVAGTSGA